MNTLLTGNKLQHMFIFLFLSNKRKPRTDNIGVKRCMNVLAYLNESK